MEFRIVGAIEGVEVIATKHSIRERKRLERLYGPGRWRKMKGIAYVCLNRGRITREEVHWYECHGIGKKELKVKFRGSA